VVGRRLGLGRKNKYINIYIMLSFDRTAYYSNYYTLKKHIYKERYIEKKMREEALIELYEKFGGEKEYIKNYWKYKVWEIKK